MEQSGIINRVQYLKNEIFLNEMKISALKGKKKDAIIKQNESLTYELAIITNIKKNEQ